MIEMGLPGQHDRLAAAIGLAVSLLILVLGFFAPADGEPRLASSAPSLG